MEAEIFAIVVMLFTVVPVVMFEIIGLTWLSEKTNTVNKKVNNVVFTLSVNIPFTFIAAGIIVSTFLGLFFFYKDLVFPFLFG